VSPTFARQTLTVVVCAAGPAQHVTNLVALAHDDGWTVDLIATPPAVHFLDLDALEQALGNPVRTRARQSTPARPRALPAASGVIVAPATFNTMCKLAAGIADNHALTTVAEAIGRRIPTVIVPFVNSAFAARVPFTRAVAELRDEGVRIILGDADGWQPHPPGTGDQRIPSFPWEAALREIAGLTGTVLP
jgi:phosphopantothenoylcysteine synthetase/decarboxylase